MTQRRGRSYLLFGLFRVQIIFISLSSTKCPEINGRTVGMGVDCLPQRHFNIRSICTIALDISVYPLERREVPQATNKVKTSAGILRGTHLHCDHNVFKALHRSLQKPEWRRHLPSAFPQLGERTIRELYALQNAIPSKDSKLCQTPKVHHVLLPQIIHVYLKDGEVRKKHTELIHAGNLLKLPAIMTKSRSCREGL